MIERQIISQKINEKVIEEFVMKFLGTLSCSSIQIQRTPLGEKLLVRTARPGIIVGRKGSNIKMLTHKLKHEFKLENPQIEVIEIENPNLDAATVAKSLVAGMERFGPKRFKAMAYKALDNVMRAGAKGVEIVISGRGIPGVRAKTWRFLAGYLKKSGNISANFVDKAIEASNLKSGTIGVKVSILPPGVDLPDDVKIHEVKLEEKVEATVKVVKEKEVIEEVKEAEKKTKKASIKKEDKAKKKSDSKPKTEEPKVKEETKKETKVETKKEVKDGA